MKKALLVGINNYPNQPLRGCVNDVVDMSAFLVKHCGFEMDNIRLLVDERASKKAIIERLGWLLTDAKSGDKILFHYSGHGCQISSRNPQGEIDGLDEAICPVDFGWDNDNAIRDKEFNKIFSTIPKGVEFIWVSDSCNSQDLSRDVIKNDNILIKRMIAPADVYWKILTAKQKNIKPLGFDKIATELNLALISGCESDKTSADAFINGKPNGALTYFLLSELKKPNGLKLSLTEIVAKINTALDEADYQQNPQLEGNSEIKRKTFFNN